MQVFVRDHLGEEGTEPEGEALNLLLDQRPNSHLRSGALGRDQKDEIMDTRCRNELPAECLGSALEIGSGGQTTAAALH